MLPPLEIYEKRIIAFQEELKHWNRKVNTWASIRLIAFLLFVAAFIFAIQFNLWLGVSLFYIFVVAFVKIIKRHRRISEKRNTTEILIEINRAEKEVLTSNTTDRDRGGLYIDSEHPFSSDLDLFGEQSLFQLIERCNTKLGKKRLAMRLQLGLGEKEIKHNQLAVNELEQKINFRQELLARRLSNTDDALNYDSINEWLKTDNAWTNLVSTRIISFLFPVIFFILVYFLVSKVGLIAGFLALVPNYLVLRHRESSIKQTQNLMKASLVFITRYESMIQLIEDENFESEKLKHIHSSFKNSGGRASSHLKKLDWFLEQLEVKNNKLLGILFNVITLWDLHFLRKIHIWKTNHHDELHKWMDSLAEMEFLSSLATLGFNNPTWTFPELHQEREIVCEEVGHPLIHKNKRVNNSISLDASTHIKLITGSNMSGKSTFLRTIGINIVLAYAGSRVCADKFKTPMLKLITSMRTVDDLKENTSGFYAELKRLSQVLDLVKKDNNVYFLIDEILKGTNTKDRHQGSKALIKQLLKHNGSGLISTHDLELAKLEKEHPEQIENKRFEVEVQGKELKFDYKIKDGVSQSFNATQLMRNMGIDI